MKRMLGGGGGCLHCASEPTWRDCTAPPPPTRQDGQLGVFEASGQAQWLEPDYGFPGLALRRLWPSLSQLQAELGADLVGLQADLRLTLANFAPSLG